MKIEQHGPQGDSPHFLALLVTQTLHQAIMHCWLAMPAQKKTVQDVETELRRILQRTLKHWSDDAIAFGGPDKQE